MARHHKSGEVFHTLFHAQAGRTQSDYDLAFYKDSVLQLSPSYTITEVTSGEYTLVVTLTGVGFWHIDVHASGNKDYDVQIEVSQYTIDDLYVLLSGQVGLKTVTLTVNDGSANVPDVQINIYDSTNTVFLTALTTNSSGQAVAVLDEGSYKLRLFKSGIATATADLTVSSASSQSATISVTATSVTAPTSPAVCRLFADFVSMDGADYSGFVVKVENLYLPTADMSVVQRESKHTSNSSGHVEFDVVRGLKIRVSFVTTSFTREITVPDAATSNLLTLMGASTDPFVVVT